MPAIVEFGFNAAPVFSGVARLDSTLQSLSAKDQRRAALQQTTGRLNLALLEAQISGNKREAASVQQRITLLERMRQIQQQTNVSQREAYVLAQRSAHLVPKAGAGARSFGMGMAAMQMQDIAVQMQMGTKASIIFAQQGSQMLSAFGPAGAIAGMVAAVAGGLYLMGEKSGEAFKKSVEGANAFRGSLKLLLAESSPDKLAGNIETISNRIKESKSEYESLTTLGGMAGGMINQWTGGPSPDKRIRDERAAQAEADDAWGLMIERTLAFSKQEVNIVELRLRGENDIADAKERELKLAQDIARIDALKIPLYAKESLTADLTAKAAADTAAAAQSAARAERERALAAADEISKKREAIALSRMSVEMLEVEARGQDRKLKKMQEQAYIQSRAHEFSSQGLDANASIALAEREWEAREKIAKRQKGGRSHIGGVQGRRLMGGHLEEFNALQLDREYKINERTPVGVKSGYRGADGHFYGGYGREFGSLADRGRMKGRMMGGDDGGALSERHASNAARSETIASSPKDTNTLLSQQNEILKQGFWGR